MAERLKSQNDIYFQMLEYLKAPVKILNSFLPLSIQTSNTCRDW